MGVIPIIAFENNFVLLLRLWLTPRDANMPYILGKIWTNFWEPILQYKFDKDFYESCLH